MKKIKQMTVLCAVIAFFACKNNDQDFKIFDMDFPDNPDKVIEKTPGRLFYGENVNGWFISSPIPGTIDSKDCYLIAEIPDKKFPFEEGKQVLVSGLCYHIPKDAFADKDVYGLGGIEWYYIKITDLK